MQPSVVRPARVSSLAVVCVMAFATVPAAFSQLTVTLTGQSMIRSDVRETAPAAVPVIADLIKGTDVIFTNFEGTIAEPGEPNETTPAQ